MVRVFDLHADLGWHINYLNDKGENDILNRYHLPKLLEGEVMYSALACFYEGSQNWEQMQQMVERSVADLKASDGKIICSADDLSETEEKVSFILTVEGMCGIREGVKEKINWLYDHGVRIGSLEWNDENALATGVGGNPLRGLTEKGKEAIHQMNRLGMIVDVSHANEHTFWNIIDTSECPVIATHSNCRSLCDVKRNLTDEQIIALTKKGGLIGMNTCRNFISSVSEEQTARTLAKHARHIADLSGSKHIACGFDYMDFFDDFDRKPYHDLLSAPETQNFIKALKEEGFSQEEIEDIAYQNVFRFLKENLK